MSKRPMTAAQVERAFAAIEKGHQLEGQQLSARVLDRARRILAGELSPDDAEVEMRDAFRKVIADEQEALRAAHSRALVGRLTEVLSPLLVSTLAGSADTQAATKWARPAGPGPEVEATERLMVAEQAWRAIREAEGDDVARAWFVGGNPRLNDDTPTTAIREARFAEIATVFRALMDDSFSGSPQSARAGHPGAPPRKRETDP